MKKTLDAYEEDRRNSLLDHDQKSMLRIDHIKKNLYYSATKPKSRTKKIYYSKKKYMEFKIV